MVLALVILGGLAEVVGIGIAARDLRDRFQARKVYDEPRDLNLTDRAGAARAGVTTERLTLGDVEVEATTPPPPTHEQRTAALERELQTLRAEMNDVSRQARVDVERVERNLPLLASDVRAAVDRDAAPMRALVDATTGGSRRAALWSIWLLVGGVIAQMVAGILSAVQ